MATSAPLNGSTNTTRQTRTPQITTTPGVTGRVTAVGSPGKHPKPRAVVGRHLPGKCPKSFPERCRTKNAKLLLSKQTTMMLRIKPLILPSVPLLGGIVVSCCCSPIIASLLFIPSVLFFLYKYRDKIISSLQPCLQPMVNAIRQAMQILGQQTQNFSDFIKQQGIDLAQLLAYWVMTPLRCLFYFGWVVVFFAVFLLFR